MNIGIQKLNKTLSKRIHNFNKNNTSSQPNRIHSRMRRSFNINKSITITDDINRMKESILLFPQVMKKPCVFMVKLCQIRILWVGFPGGASGKEPVCQCRRCKRRGFSPWVRKIPWRKAWQPTPVFLPGQSHGQGSLEGSSP